MLYDMILLWFRFVMGRIILCYLLRERLPRGHLEVKVCLNFGRKGFTKNSRPGVVFPRVYSVRDWLFQIDRVHCTRLAHPGKQTIRLHVPLKYAYRATWRSIHSRHIWICIANQILMRNLHKPAIDLQTASQHSAPFQSQPGGNIKQWILQVSQKKWHLQ